MLLNTTVQRWDGARCYYPNVVLNANPLLNLTRSENKTDNIQVRPLPPPTPVHMCVPKTCRLGRTGTSATSRLLKGCTGFWILARESASLKPNFAGNMELGI